MEQASFCGQWLRHRLRGSGAWREALPVSARRSSLCSEKRKGWSLPGGVEWGGEDKEHSREMALVKDWHRPPHWDVNLNRGPVGWGLSYSCWWAGLGLLAGVGGPGWVTIRCWWKPLPSHRLIQTRFAMKYILLYFTLFGKLSFSGNKSSAQAAWTPKVCVKPDGHMIWEWSSCASRTYDHLHKEFTLSMAQLFLK